jgi:1-acyl-sn-glycerol-3-phosphate acyltransferase
MAGPAPVPLYPLKDRLPAAIYWLYRGTRTILVASCFAVFWSGAVLLGWIWLPIVRLWPASRADRMRRIHRSVRRGFGLFHWMMRVLRLYHRVSTVQVLRPAGSPVVLVANHPTLCDVTSIASLFPDVVAVARPSFARNPLLGPLVRGCGFVPTGIHVLRECQERLRMGFDVLVFPEGTRSPVGGALHPFHRGAFELAERAGVPIVLLKLTCVPSALSKGLPIWKVADRMAVLTIEPIATIDPAASGPGSKVLCREIERRYRELLGYPVATGAAGAAQPVGDLP